MSDFLLVTVTALGLAVLAMVVSAVVARRIGRVNVVDVTWGLALTTVALAAAALADSWLSWIVAALVTAWGLRLSWHIFTRSRGKGEDPRYEELLDGGGFRAAIGKVFVLQGAAIWFVSWPVQSAALASSWSTSLVVVGAAVWLVGLLFETIGDAQLESYKADPDRGPVMDRGLWAWTRHPNYFGDSCVWWGVWLVGGAATGWLPALVTLPSPVVMTWFLAYATGARPLEKKMMQREGYRDYAARTSMFVPLPPRRRA